MKEDRQHSCLLVENQNDIMVREQERRGQSSDNKQLRKEYGGLMVQQGKWLLFSTFPT